VGTGAREAIGARTTVPVGKEAVDDAPGGGKEWCEDWAREVIG
jgi:hypothetical protein